MIKKKKTQRNVHHLEIILGSIIGTTIVSRLITYFVLVRKTLPSGLFVNFGEFRLHHFVYGNILLVTTSFLVIGLGVKKNTNLLALLYGIGLGLVLDEFLLWIGDTKLLSSYVLFVPYSIPVISIVCVVIISLILYQRQRP